MTGVGVQSFTRALALLLRGMISMRLQCSNMARGTTLKEERLELRARSAAAIGPGWARLGQDGPDGPDTVFRAGRG